MWLKFSTTIVLEKPCTVLTKSLLIASVIFSCFMTYISILLLHNKFFYFKITLKMSFANDITY